MCGCVICVVSIHPLPQLQMQNDVEARSIDAIFASNQAAQASIRGLEEAIEREKLATETLVEGMDTQTAANYRQLQEEETRIEQVPLV